MTDLEHAKALLQEGNHTLVLMKGNVLVTSAERGVTPLVALLDGGRDVRNFSAADRVVGKAAAFLYVLLGVKEVYAEVLSAPAEEVLCRHGIVVESQTHTERIINRAGTGLCPMETAVGEIEEPKEALSAIRARLEAMKKDRHEG